VRPRVARLCLRDGLLRGRNSSIQFRSDRRQGLVDETLDLLDLFSAHGPFPQGAQYTAPAGQALSGSVAVISLSTATWCAA
jgi:hypothetical protein